MTLALRLAARSSLPAQAARAMVGSGARGGAVVVVRPFSATQAALVKKPSSSRDAKKKTLAAKAAKAAKSKAAAKKKKKASAKKPAKKVAKLKKKKKPAKPVKKKLTREQLARQRDRNKKREAIQHRKDLKEASLIREEPRPGLNRAYVVFTAEKGPALRAKGLRVTEVAKQLSSDWKVLPEAEQDRYKNIASSNQEAYLKNYEAWVKKYTPAEIHKANAARKALKRQGVIDRPRIKDNRLPAGFKNAYASYVQEHVKQHKEEGKKTQELFSEAAIAWKSFTADEKRPFEEMSEKDKKRYEQEKALLYG